MILEKFFAKIDKLLSPEWHFHVIELLDPIVDIYHYSYVLPAIDFASTVLDRLKQTDKDIEIPLLKFQEGEPQYVENSRVRFPKKHSFRTKLIHLVVSGPKMSPTMKPVILPHFLPLPRPSIKMEPKPQSRTKSMTQAAE